MKRDENGTKQRKSAKTDENRQKGTNRGGGHRASEVAQRDRAMWYGRATLVRSDRADPLLIVCPVFYLSLFGRFSGGHSGFSWGDS